MPSRYPDHNFIFPGIISGPNRLQINSIQKRLVQLNTTFLYELNNYGMN